MSEPFVVFIVGAGMFLYGCFDLGYQVAIRRFVPLDEERDPIVKPLSTMVFGFFLLYMGFYMK